MDAVEKRLTSSFRPALEAGPDSHRRLI